MLGDWMSRIGDTKLLNELNLPLLLFIKGEGWDIGLGVFNDKGLNLLGSSIGVWGLLFDQNI